MKHPFLYSFVLVLPVLFSGCHKEETETNPIDYRTEMRNFVKGLSRYAKAINLHFIIIPQNGQELITDNGEGNGTPDLDYMNAFDATGRESLFYGDPEDNVETTSDIRQHLLDLCLLCERHGIEVLSVDYCSSHGKMDSSYLLNSRNGFISFAANERNLNNIPSYPATPYHENNTDICNISQAQNFLYLINSERYNSKQDFINAVAATNYDVIIMDLFHNDESYTQSEIEQLKNKQNGGKRLVICYLSIGEAEEYRYYWDPTWQVGNPVWLGSENPEWEGNYKVKYWNSDWQSIIYGNSNSYLKKILDAGFDGAYLDLIDAFEYYEEK